MLKLRSSQSDRLFKIDLISFKKSDSANYFLLESSDNSDVNVSVPYTLETAGNYKTEDFECIPFISPIFYKESNIFEIHVEDKKIGRLGWIFPIQSIISIEHSYSQNEHFLKYAFVTFRKLLLGEFFTTDIIIDVSSFDSEIQIDQIYPSSLIVLSLSKAKTKNINVFSVEDYLPDLYIHKYFLCEFPEEDSQVQRINTDLSETSKVTIRPIAEDLKEEIYIKSLFKNHFKQNNHPLVQFHLLYQIIELLIIRVYDCEINRIVTIASERTKPFHDIKKEIENLIKEETRIRKLFADYLLGEIATEELLIQACNKLLKLVNKEKTGLVDAFYHVRNTLVHNYRSISNTIAHIDDLSKINIEFEKVLVDVLIYYTESKGGIDYTSPLAWLMYKMLQERDDS
jgi:hypothetical protein